MSEPCGHDHQETRFRLVGFIELDDDAHIQVNHVYGNETCEEHGNLTDEGFVGLAVHVEAPGEEQHARILLDARDALLLADRLTRAAHLVLELDESLPDPEREFLRHSKGEQVS